MVIWIDNDGCPRTVRDTVFKTALRLKIEVNVVANSYIKVPVSTLIKTYCVPKSFDAADNYIADRVKSGDLVVTSDIPLASRVVANGAIALSSRGDIFDPSNVGERLAMRNLMQELRSGGEIRGGPPSLNDKDQKKFADAFDRLVTKLNRA